MGCNSSSQVSTSTREDRRKELRTCSEFCSDVRWSWLKGHTLFTFGELRNLLKLYQGAISEPLDSPSGMTAPVSTSGENQGPSYSILVSCGGDILGKRQGFTGTLSKAQFLVVCESDEALRLSVGAFGSRLFDVLDEDGDGRLDFEDFATGFSKLLKGQESDKLNLMYAVYDLSGVVPSEEKIKWSGGRKVYRRSKYLTVENITAILASVSLYWAYPTLLFFAKGKEAALRETGIAVVPQQGRKGAGAVEHFQSPPAPTEILQKLAQRNASLFAERAVSKFGQVKAGTLTPKEFEKWALTGPVMRCRINEFSIDVNIAPFQGVRLD